jgi:arylsulfatase
MRQMDELGGPMTFNHYPIGWAHAMDTPFQWTKQIASHFGGTRNGLVISWPARIKDKSGIRTQFHHVIDIAPTILEAVGVQSPSMLNGVPQKPIEDVSMVYTFADAKVRSRCTPPAQPDPRPHRVYLLSRHDAHSRRQRARLQEQVL